MDREKYVDESWKDSVAKERQPDSAPPSSSTPQASQPAAENPAAENSAENSGEIPEVNFVNYATGLAFQTMIFLGEILNPFTDKTEKNLPQAKFLIDTLAMIREKTKGNLNPQENDFLNASLYELQMKYVEHFQKETK